MVYRIEIENYLKRIEIENYLKKTSSMQCVAFARRCALRVLPLLAAMSKGRETFWYWKGDAQSDNLLSILVSVRFSVDITAATNAAESARTSFGRAAADAADAACAAARSGTSADVATRSAAAAAVVAAARSAAVKAAKSFSGGVDYDLSKVFESAMLDDLHLICPTSKQEIVNCGVKKQNFNDRMEALEFLRLPLWESGEIPKMLLPAWNRFCRWCYELNPGFDMWLDWYRNCVTGKEPNIELLKKQINVPIEVLKQGVVAVNAYLGELEKGDVKPLNIVRAIFVGNGGAGKTSIIRVLHGYPVVAGTENMTPGIEIHEWDVDETDIKARLWDFGGQVMAHSTHQFFLRERCLYVLVIDARSEINADDQAVYWLEHVKAFGKDAPVMIVGNKFDLMPVNLDIRGLKEKYQNITGFYPVSCINLEGDFKASFKCFKTDLIDQLLRVGTHQVCFTKGQFGALAELRKRSIMKSFLPHEEFEELCVKYKVGIKGGMSKSDFLGMLDKLGEVIYFPQLKRLDCYVLNPRWLTYGVYTLLYSELIHKQNGELSKGDVIQILNARKIEDERGNTLEYPEEKCGFIIDAMEEFKLCYRLPEDNERFVIPDKLPSVQPELEFSKGQDGTLVFEYQFSGFLPRHVMPTLIACRHNELIEDMVWQNGVVLFNKELLATACAQVDYHSRTLRLWTQGPGAREMLAILNDEVLKILKRMETLEFSGKVVLPLSARIDGRIGVEDLEKASYQQLLASAKRGILEFISESGVIYDLNKVLGMFMSDEKRKKEDFNFNNKGDVNIANLVTGDTGGGMAVNISTNKVDLKTAAHELEVKFKELVDNIIEFPGNAKDGLAALKDFKEVSTLLENVDTAKADQKNRLKLLLGKIKTGTFTALSYAGKIKGNAKTIAWIVGKAEHVAEMLR